MAYSYGEPTRTISVSPYHSHGDFPYSFWGGTLGPTHAGGYGPGMYGPGMFGPGMRPGYGRGMFGMPSAMLSGGVPMRFTRFKSGTGGSVSNLQFFPALRTFMQAARDYEALEMKNLVKKGKKEYQLKRWPALRGSIKGMFHYAIDPSISVADMVRTRKNEIALEHGDMSQDGYKFAELNIKTKNLKRGFKWGLDGDGYTSHLVEKLKHLNACFGAEELDRGQYESTVQQIVDDLKDFFDMKAITEKEYRDTLEQIRGSVVPARGLSR